MARAKGPSSPKSQKERGRQKSRKNGQSNINEASHTHQARKKRPNKKKKSYLALLLYYGLIATLWGIMALAACVIYFAWDMPNPTHIILNTTRAPNISIYAQDGSFIFGKENYTPVVLKELPRYVPEAIISAEDKRFFDHPAIDPIGLIRASIIDIFKGHFTQGGSTLTQQTAKNIFLSPQKNLKRKVQEILLAFWLEHYFTKQQILTIYLNRVYLGGGNYGINAASMYYFGHPAKQMTLSEATLIAALLKAPSSYSPLLYPKRALQRAHTIIQIMQDEGYITRQQAQNAIHQPLILKQYSQMQTSSRYFAEWVIAQAKGYLGHIDHDIIIHTTLLPRLQNIAAYQTAQLQSKMQQSDISQLGFIAMNHQGAILSMIGGSNWNITEFNHATNAMRQPGSTFKLFVFLTAFQQGYTPDSLISTKHFAIKGWSPKNAEHITENEITIRQAMALSVNSATARLGEKIGLRNIIKTARRIGLTTPLFPDPALSLGVFNTTLLDMTNAYNTAANGGYSVTPYTITSITDQQGHILYQHQRDPAVSVISAANVAKIDDLLTSVIARGTGKNAQFILPPCKTEMCKARGNSVKGKTGTSQNFRDAWFIGYTPDITGGVWMGNDNNSTMNHVYGGSLPAKLWKNIMQSASISR